MTTETEIIRQTAGLVAEHLDGWSVDPSWDTMHNARLVNGDGAIYLALATASGKTWGDNKTHVRATVSYPDGVRDVYPRPEYPTAKIKRDRGPDVIAREITRRVLPAYLGELERVQAAILKHREAESRQVVALARLVAALPGSTLFRDGEARTPHSEVTGYGDIRVWAGGERADLHLRNLPVRLAEQILGTIATYTAGDQ